MRTPNMSLYSIVDIAEQHAQRQRMRNNLTLDEILKDVCNAMDCDIKKVKSKNRKHENVICRQIYCYIAKLKTHHGFREIGEIIGSRDHTTVIHGKDAVIGYLKISDPKFMPDWDKYLDNSKLFTETDF